MLPLLVEGEDDCSTPAASHCLIRGYEAIDGRSTNILSQSLVYTGTRLPCGGSSYIATVNALVSCPFRTGILCLVDCVNIKAFRRVITLHQATVGDAVFVGATNKSTLFACLRKCLCSSAAAWYNTRSMARCYCFLLWHPLARKSHYCSQLHKGGYTAFNKYMQLLFC